MAFCSNCGAKQGNNEKFCGECGYRTGQPSAPVQTAQPRQMVSPAPPLHTSGKTDPKLQKKKKSKAPLIIAVMAVFVIGIGTAAYFTGVFNLFGNAGLFENGGGITISTEGTPSEFLSTVTSGITVEIPSSTSADEKAAYEYLQGVVEAFDYGMEYEEIGLIRPAESFYGTAASSLCSLRYALDCLLGEESGNGRINDWDAIASMGWGSPAAYFFEGLVCHAKGNADEAAACWTKAKANPLFAEDSGGDLKGIANISGDALRRLRDEAARVEDEMFKLHTPSFYPVPRHENNYDPVYLSRQGAACLQQDEPDDVGALMYYRAALSVNPFSGYNYACVVVAYISIGDGTAAEVYLTEGLIIDPEDKTLNALIEKIGEAANQ
ncbi:MAG: zinc ribbon domain-containing protein [Defluviitaleaceae bacterium]|nr:zinc ribbon domain-containing protein [Defluviitaleaceae bacterium]